MHCDYVTVKVVKISSGHVRTCHIQDNRTGGTQVFNPVH